ncbi:MAG TPA: glycerol-3-phosphate 1-O-acyltransferase PlsY [Bryobacteraceae bacterium]|jgi:glycerol-3-phosphate acyltransferase PlsY
MLTGLLTTIAAYLLGAIPFGFLLVKLTSGKDVRASGSGNIGATNVLRTSGKGLGIATLILDILKGLAAVWLASWLTNGSPLWTSLAALAVMAGHSYSVFLGFKGGKAVASFVGAFAYLTPLPLLAVAILFFTVVASTRYISAGSVVAAGTFPLGVWLILHPSPELLAASIVAGWFIVYRHRGNLDRIRAGTENVFRWSK